MVINLFPAIRVISSEKAIAHHKLNTKKHTDKVQHLEAKEVKKSFRHRWECWINIPQVDRSVTPNEYCLPHLALSMWKISVKFVQYKYTEPLNT